MTKQHKLCVQNERVKRAYLIHMKEARGRSVQTVDQAAAAIDGFQSFTRHRDFKHFSPTHAREWKTYLLEEPSERTGKPLALSAARSQLRHLRDFLLWLAQEPGYRSKLTASDMDYFNLSSREERIARASEERPIPTVEEATRTLADMPCGTEIERRDRALFALAIIAAPRISALRTLKLKHFDLENGTLDQRPPEVETKNGKHIYTAMFGVSPKARAIVGEWIGYLRNDLGFSSEAPFFPQQKVDLGKGHRFEIRGLEPAHYATNEPLRSVFRRAFEASGVHPYHPHTFRHMIATHYARLGVDAATATAIAQSLGHEHLATMMQTYVKLSRADQVELVKNAGAHHYGESADQIVSAFAAFAQSEKGRRVLRGLSERSPT